MWSGVWASHRHWVSVLFQKQVDIWNTHFITKWYFVDPRLQDLIILDNLQTPLIIFDKSWYVLYLYRVLKAICWCTKSQWRPRAWALVTTTSPGWWSTTLTRTKFNPKPNSTSSSSFAPLTPGNCLKRAFKNCNLIFVHGQPILTNKLVIICAWMEN